MRCMREVRRHGYHPGGRSLFKGGSPHSRPQASWTKSSLTCPRVPPYDTRARFARVMQAGPGQKKPNRPAVTSTPPPSPKPVVERANRHAGGMQPHHGDAPLRFRRIQHGGPGPRHVTGVSVTTCEKLHRHLRQCRASSTAEPVPRLEATLRMAQQCQPSTSVTGQSAAGGDATVDIAKSGPTVMTAAGERKQQSNRLQAHVPS
jgi:hypothetical protein